MLRCVCAYENAVAASKKAIAAGIEARAKRKRWFPDAEYLLQKSGPFMYPEGSPPGCMLPWNGKCYPKVERRIRNITINFGCQHSSASPWRIVLELDGETVLRAQPHIGFMHRGVEKLAESSSYWQSIPHLDRLDWVAALANEHAYVLAVEKMSRLRPPIRAQFVRVLLVELTRIMSHSAHLAALANALGQVTAFHWLYEEREKILELLERVSGARLLPNYFRPGGIAMDIPLGYLDAVHRFVQGFLPRLDSLQDVLETRFWDARLKGIGVIAAGEALEWGCTGVVLRATGVCWDLRIVQPYECYCELGDFLVPVGSNGDCLDRYKLRCIEMRVSCDLVSRCCSLMPLGEILADDFKTTGARKRDIGSSMEAMLTHSVFWSEGGPRVPSGNVYVAVEHPQGEMGVWLTGDGTSRPYRLHVRSPGFPHLASLERIAPGLELADLVAVLASYDLVAGDVDR